MRISGGIWRGRVLRVPPGRVRPTQDMVRQALFSMLGGRVAGAAFLDLFAGSGAVGLEAASRGAGSVCWVEADRRAGRVLRENVAAFFGTPGKPGSGPRECAAAVVSADAFRFLAARARARFDVVFADPPYELAGDRAWIERLLGAIAPVSRIGGVCVIEHSVRGEPPEAAGWLSLRRRTYGETALSFLERADAK